ncbi:MAG: nitroreductase family protein [Victivallaceae bacterium]|nr:nitroreductase family protein [Victivallaceae bacterium]
MDFYEVIRKRRSIRSYKSDPIPEAALQRIAEAVHLAPSACNFQPWKIKIVTDPGLRAQISANYTRDWLIQAPAIAVIIGNSKQCWKRFDGTPSVNIDIGIAMEHLILAATAEGLATCWIGAYDMAKMNAVLGVVPPWNVLALSPLGYADQEPTNVPRKPINKIFEIV